MVVLIILYIVFMSHTTPTAIEKPVRGDQPPVREHLDVLVKESGGRTMRIMNVSSVVRRYRCPKHGVVGEVVDSPTVAALRPSPGFRMSTNGEGPLLCHRCYADLLARECRELTVEEIR